LGQWVGWKTPSGKRYDQGEYAQHHQMKEKGKGKIPDNSSRKSFGIFGGISIQKGKEGKIPRPAQFWPVHPLGFLMLFPLLFSTGG